MAKKPNLEPVTAKAGKVSVKRLKLQLGPTAPKPGSMLLDKKIKRSKGLS